MAVYRDRSLYTMRTDALDRFGTRFERRFTRVAMLDLMRRAGLEHIELSDAPPFWCAVARRAGSAQSKLTRDGAPSSGTRTSRGLAL